MREFVDAGEVLKIKVGVNLGGRDVCVTQQFLDAAQILARLEQMRGEGVTEEMRVYVHRQALFAGATRHAGLNRARCDRATFATDEQRGTGGGRVSRAYREPSA